jgi:zinc/manganese transport system permease protein
MDTIGLRRRRGRDLAAGIVLGTAIGLSALFLYLTTTSGAIAGPDLATARGAPARLAGLAFTLALAVSVGLSSLAIGAILSTALLIGPAAAAVRLTRTVPAALAAACLIGVAATWLGILLAYDSYYWDRPARRCPSASSLSP